MTSYRGNAYRLVGRAISDARVVGTAHLLCGAVLLFILVMSSRGVLTNWQMMRIAAVSVILVGPGVLYHVAAHLLRKREAWAIRLGMYGGIAHVGAALLIFALTTALDLWSTLLMPPTVVCLFLMPAMIAFIIHLQLARRAAEMLADDVPAFTPVMPLDDPELDGPTE